MSPDPTLQLRPYYQLFWADSTSVSSFPIHIPLVFHCPETVFRVLKPHALLYLKDPAVGNR